MILSPNSLLLIGSSHVGKSTCALSLGAAVRWPVISTDRLGRHPGRPWMDVPAAVVEFYLRMSDDAIHWFLKTHHENMRSLIGNKIKAACEMGEGFILEGAALRPEYLDDWKVGEALAVCLYVEPSALQERIQIGSNYSQQSNEIKVAIDKFTERSVRENQALTQSAVKHNVQVVNVTHIGDADRLVMELAFRLKANV